MTVRCPSCSANLKVNLERLRGRPSAKCPSCHASVPLPQQDNAGAAEQQSASGPAAVEATIVVTCQSCKTRLKAPASRAGARSTCPKCRAMVLIEGSPSVMPNVLVANAGADAQEESSSASTRRIDSRMLGMINSGSPAQGSAGVDLEAFLKTGAAGPSHKPSETPSELPRTDPGNVAPLLNPPVAALESIAHEIRKTAEQLTHTPEAESVRTSNSAERVSSEAGTPPSPRAGRRPIRSVVDHTEDHATHGSQSSMTSDQRTFPAWRGILSGGVAGLLVGAAQGALSMTPFASLLPPMPFPAGILELPEMAMRVLFVALLGIVSGFIAGAIGSPRFSDHPLSLMRCGATALLMGLACALVGGLVTGTGVQVWPIANWMRDLLLVGLLTPALHRILPAPRS